MHARQPSAFVFRNPIVEASIRLPQRTLELACHFWHPIYLALCANAGGNVSLLRAHKLSWPVARGAGRVPIAIDLGTLVVTDKQREEGCAG